jgi:hypothetical protein
MDGIDPLTHNLIFFLEQVWVGKNLVRSHFNLIHSKKVQRKMKNKSQSEMWHLELSVHWSTCFDLIIVVVVLLSLLLLSNKCYWSEVHIIQLIGRFTTSSFSMKNLVFIFRREVYFSIEKYSIDYVKIYVKISISLSFFTLSFYISVITVK